MLKAKLSEMWHTAIDIGNVSMASQNFMTALMDLLSLEETEESLMAAITRGEETIAKENNSPVRIQLSLI